VHNLAVTNRRRHAGSARFKPDCTAARQKLPRESLEQLRLRPVGNRKIVNGETVNREIQESSLLHFIRIETLAMASNCVRHVLLKAQRGVHILLAVELRRPAHEKIHDRFQGIFPAHTTDTNLGEIDVGTKGRKIRN
jgi:hypothetical protein